MNRIYESTGGRFEHLIASLHGSTGQKVAVLVDEYDKPILNALNKPDVATANRGTLRNLYGTIKDSDAHIRLSFITGVSKFSKVSLFSGLNQLNDITLDADYSAICGDTEADLKTVFAPEFTAPVKPGGEKPDPDRIRDWYNGYSWLGPEDECRIRTI